MPELPEVEITVRYLRQHLRGQVILGADFLWKRTLAPQSKRKFLTWLPGAGIDGVSRRGKYIVVALKKKAVPPKACLLIHLRMSGSVDVVSARLRRGKHDRFIMRLGNQRELRFDDPRKFGRVYLVPHHSVVTDNLGIEPFDRSLTPALFLGMLQACRGAIKPLLLRQSFMAGIGNIYADESLWRARIHPLTAARQLSGKQARCLLQSIRSILRTAIKTQGTDNGDNVVKGGMYQPKVYGRDGQPCRRCRATITKLVVGQRGTHICPRCQRRENL